MAGRHSLLAVVLFAAVLHVIVVTQTILPAQDGLKFIRIARQFQTQPWSDVVRGSDSHPLYPALIAAAEPLVARFAGHGPDAWRIAAQIVAVIASVGLILPDLRLDRSRSSTGGSALLAAALAALLPRAAELGRDTLSDSLGLMLTFYALWWGAIALKRSDWRFAVGAGLSAGLGYLARPEVILVPVVILLTWLCRLASPRFGFAPIVRSIRNRGHHTQHALAVVGSYAAVKGELSEKLAIRHVLALGPHHTRAHRAPHQLPQGLDDPRWDFSPKEESDHIPIRNWRYSVMRIAGKWWEELCWLFAVMTVWGLVRQRFIRGLCPNRAP